MTHSDTWTHQSSDWRLEVERELEREERRAWRSERPTDPHSIRFGGLVDDSGDEIDEAEPARVWHVERIERVVQVERQLGVRKWSETRTEVVYRSVLRCRAELWGRRCEWRHSHDGPHHSPAQEHGGSIELALTW